MQEKIAVIVGDFFHLVTLLLRRRHFENTRVFFIHTLNVARLNLASGANYERRQEDGVLKILRFLILNRQGDRTDMGVGAVYLEGQYRIFAPMI
jgi:hypothetical protein